MPRKPHRKSRNGCAVCKRRHVKCDESRPSCVNCVTAGVQCAFLIEEQARRSRSTLSGLESPASSGSRTPTDITGNHVDEISSTTSHVPPLLSSVQSVPDPYLNMDHIELLHHFCTVTYKTLTPDCSQQEMWQTTAIKLGISFPFLMHEILAIAALHLAHGRAEEQSHYYTKATELQNHALAGFNAVRRNVGPSNGAAILLFTSLLALHVIADPSRSTGLDPSDYINHFLGCISLMRGVRHVISGDAWVYIKESELKPLLLAPDPPELYDIPEECRALVRLSDDIEPGSTSSRAYNTAIERLHWSFARTNVSEPLPTLRWAMAWLALLKDDYLELLSQRQPQALIILAYYGVLLHFTRNCWPLCNSGAYLVKAINALMGPQLGQWMAWPIKMIASNGEERQDQGDE